MTIARLNMHSIYFINWNAIWILKHWLVQIQGVILQHLPDDRLTWSVIKRISFKIKPNSYSVDDLMHVWWVTASGIRVLPIGPMLPSSPCLFLPFGGPGRKRERNAAREWLDSVNPIPRWLVTHKPCDRRPDCVAVFRRASWGDNCAGSHRRCPVRWPEVISKSFIAGE